MKAFLFSCDYVKSHAMHFLIQVKLYCHQVEHLTIEHVVHHATKKGDFFQLLDQQIQLSLQKMVFLIIHQSLRELVHQTSQHILGPSILTM
jgi:hypothetical protein